MLDQGPTKYWSSHSGRTSPTPTGFYYMIWLVCHRIKGLNDEYGNHRVFALWFTVSLVVQFHWNRGSHTCVVHTNLTYWISKEFHLNINTECLFIKTKWNFTYMDDHTIYEIDKEITKSPKMECLTFEIETFSLYCKKLVNKMDNMWCWSGAPMVG